MIDNSEIVLQENIPLTDADLIYLETNRKAAEKIVKLIPAIITLAVMAFISFFIKDQFRDFKYYDYILFAGAGLVMFGFTYGVFWLLNRYDIYNWKKDISQGKNRLKSEVIHRDKTEYGEYLTFAGPLKNDQIRTRVKPEDYRQYAVGAKVIVTYLKFSKEALMIVEVENTIVT